MKQRHSLRSRLVAGFVVVALCGGIAALIQHPFMQGHHQSARTAVEQPVAPGSSQDELIAICSPRHSLLMATEMISGDALQVHFWTPQGLQDRSLIVTVHCGIPDQLSTQILGRRKDPAMREGMFVYHPGYSMAAAAPDLWASSDGATLYFCNDKLLEEHGVGACDVTVPLTARPNAITGLFLLGTYGIDPPNRVIIPSINKNVALYFLQHASFIRQEIDSKLP